MTKSGAAWLVCTLGALALLFVVLDGFALKRTDMHASDTRINEMQPADTDAAQATRRPLVMAHRGGAGVWPENTAHAFAHAAALGVDVLEMDLHATADGALVVIHDATVDRTTNGTGRVSALTLAELKRFDAGYRWTNDGGRTYPFRGTGITVPTLREVLERFPQTRLNIDIKQAQPSIVEPFCRTLSETRATERVTVASFSSQTLAEFRRACPEVATSAGAEEVGVLSSELQAGRGVALKPTPFRIVQVPEWVGGRAGLTPEAVAALKRAGLEIHVWTINEEASMRRMIALGVDGIMTDYPDKLLALLRRTPPTR
ncbi:MAG TPA: glycerophosphodiester phosphodiesterase [Pyrinomonadaceae bacterium]|nr:glycerophosphodiester phosphodiesterase [Pyrinomonadaceae bacterium]